VVHIKRAFINNVVEMMIFFQTIHKKFETATGERTNNNKRMSNLDVIILFCQNSKWK
jgi:hypothetical protein